MGLRPSALWRDSLAPLWKQRAAAVAGITTGPALFSLEQLARGALHVVTRREDLGTSGAVGSDWAFSSDADVASYRDAYCPLAGQPDERLASAAVAPVNTEQVQKIVRIANRWCAPCHAPGITHPGTHALERKYSADKFPARKRGGITEWTNLTPDYVMAIVRTGISVMPFFRKTKISDTGLDALARFVTAH